MRMQPGITCGRWPFLHFYACGQSADTKQTQKKDTKRPQIFADGPRYDARTTFTIQRQRESRTTERRNRQKKEPDTTRTGVGHHADKNHTPRGQPSAFRVDKGRKGCGQESDAMWTRVQHHAGNRMNSMRTRARLHTDTGRTSCEGTPDITWTRFRPKTDNRKTTNPKKFKDP